MKYDKTLCLNNIRHLAKSKGINLGDLETGAGVSAGYLSRLSKEDNKSNPSIEVLAFMAEKLGVSVDALIGYDYAGMSPTEGYVMAFIEKIIKKSATGEINWDKDVQATFAQLTHYRDDSTSHPLFIVRNNDSVYNSYFAPSEGTKPAGEFYHTPIDDTTTLYVTQVQHRSVTGVDYEVYFTSYEHHQDHWSIEPVCATNPAQESVFDDALKRLYEAAADCCRNVKVNASVRRTIDRFMAPLPWEDGTDDSGELPF